ncbi:uncharacterized protein FA14DRAFT_65482 [Meira miltonrushii]|uniref:Uncharacterized protein n=1 Tax=Meira miltonrushii TaxID=1280837 RepID=A0A316V855_9BASI|nr:uncharacterized protein FA14DRAFT_65482 [Meira miltonrushii]PWN33807.1 hypothetical protein FA14DRAFT_65482 [Meira miltonrushii]
MLACVYRIWLSGVGFYARESTALRSAARASFYTQHFHIIHTLIPTKVYLAPFLTFYTHTQRDCWPTRDQLS